MMLSEVRNKLDVVPALGMRALLVAFSVPVTHSRHCGSLSTYRRVLQASPGSRHTSCPGLESAISPRSSGAFCQRMVRNQAQTLGVVDCEFINPTSWDHSRVPSGPLGVASLSTPSLHTWCLWLPGPQVMQDDVSVAGPSSPATRGLRQAAWCLWGWRCPVAHPGTKRSLGTLPFSSRSRRRFSDSEPDGSCSATDLRGQGKPPPCLRPSFLVRHRGTLAVTLCTCVH
ncbi:uncharacterized protein LOC105300416 [Pteropus vampyrus]|uniref:Uncharacterized protein LOC105300416 n=1 Tax=Pteropus vampyrus TaxID=132908 RepID=A0A6P6D2U2_PTEVA|nr:uncharacterized protein LOC105300416 [Pteropus vampyrus]XP_023393866.1 uncharacterized protein LOC105300416 [Pteropus vampyrus]XP_023393867.1 uncharacterized protein LOC105300416 [Pteropus vampyrus]